MHGLRNTALCPFSWDLASRPPRLPSHSCLPSPPLPLPSPELRPYPALAVFPCWGGGHSLCAVPSKWMASRAWLVTLASALSMPPTSPFKPIALFMAPVSTSGAITALFSWVGSSILLTPPSYLFLEVPRFALFMVLPLPSPGPSIVIYCLDDGDKLVTLPTIHAALVTTATQCFRCVGLEPSGAESKACFHCSFSVTLGR